MYIILTKTTYFLRKTNYHASENPNLLRSSSDDAASTPKAMRRAGGRGAKYEGWVTRLKIREPLAEVLKETRILTHALQNSLDTMAAKAPRNARLIEFPILYSSDGKLN